MDQQSRDITTWALGTLVSLCVLVGLAARFILLPWLREKLLGPVQEVHKQVSENHHATPEAPTLPDRLDDLNTAVQALAMLMDSHQNWSDRYTRKVDRRLKRLEQQNQQRLNGGTAP